MATTYTYEQIHQLTTQAGYQGAQADAIAKQLYNSQTSGTSKTTTPTLDEMLQQFSMRGMKLMLGIVLGIVGVVALFRPDIPGLIESANAPLRAASAVESIRSSRATRKLRTVQTAKATHELEQARATAPLASRSGSGGTIGEQPGNEPTSGGRPVKPTKPPKTATPRDAEQVAWDRLQREQRKRTPNVEAARQTWEAIATPEQVARRQGQTVRRNNKESAGEREAPDISVSEQRRQGHLRRAPLPGGTIGAQPARRGKRPPKKAPKRPPQNWSGIDAIRGAIPPFDPKKKGNLES